MSMNKQAVDEILTALEESGYEFGVAIATEPEIAAQAACGMLSIITTEDVKEQE